MILKNFICQLLVRMLKHGYCLRAIIFALVLFSLSILPEVSAQDFKRQYRQAKDLFDEGNYSAAMDAFKSLTVYDKENPYPEYASFYYAVAAQRMGFLSVAKDMFLQIKNLYPNWEQRDEVNYWLAKIYFDQGEIFQGFQIAKLIQNPSFEEDITNQKKSSLAKISDVETLKMLLEENPLENTVAYSLAKALSKLEFPNQETKWLDSLVNFYHFPKEDFTQANDKTSVFKESYRVALLFPFLASTLEPTPVIKRNQRILDLYEGMRMAADTLNKQGIRIDFLAYDTQRDPEIIKNLLKEEELKSADLIVGPLFPEGSVNVQEFSKENKINLVVSPLTNDADFLSISPYALLYQPSYETLGIKSAEFLNANTTNKNCIVYFGENPKDSIQAFSFMKRALSLGMKIVLAQELRKETSGSILSTLVKPTEFDEWKNPTQFKLKKDSIGSIYVASDNALIYAKVINSVEARGDGIWVAGQEGWLNDASVDLQKFEKISVALASPNFSPYTSSAYLNFRRAFLLKHGILPNDDVKIGYEFIVTFGKALHQYGVYFQQSLLQESPPLGELGQGYQLQSTRDNGKVSFVGFKSGELVILGNQ